MKCLAEHTKRLSAKAIIVALMPCLYATRVTLGDPVLNARGVVVTAETVQKIVASATKPLVIDGVGSLTPEVAAELQKCRHTLTLNGVTSLPLDAAQLLAKHPAYLTINDLCAINDDVAEILARRSQPISLPHLKEITSIPLAIKLADNPTYTRLPQWSLKFDKIAVLDPDIGRALANHKAKGLSLCGIVDLTPELARALQGGAAHHLVLNGVKELSPETAIALCGNNGTLSLNGLADLSEETAKALSAYNGGAIHLDSIASLDPATEELLGQYPGRLYMPALVQLQSAKLACRLCSDDPQPTRRANSILRLDHLKYLSPEAVYGFKQEEIRLNGLTELTPVLVDALRSKSGLELNGLATLTPDFASKLAGRRRLILDGLSELPLEVGRELICSGGTLGLNGLEAIPDELAGELARHRGTLLLGGLKKLSPAAASAFASRKCGRDDHLSLAGLEEIDDEAARALAEAKTRIYIRSRVDKKKPLPSSARDILSANPYIKL